VSLKDLLGQPDVVDTLERALGSGRLHHAYRFEGPPGVGKELAAFGVARALLCTEGPALGCGACSACRRAVTLSEGEPHVPLHPDVVLVQTGLYRESVIGKDEKVGVSVEQIRRVVLAQVGFTPAEGRARIFIFRDADELTPAAANALLKTLEEPRPATHFLLLTSRPDRLLPTVRSRSVLVRFRPLSAALLEQILIARGVPAPAARAAAPLADGSVEKALELADPERASARASFIAGAFEAARAGTAGAAVLFAESFDGDRREARERLHDVAAHLAAAAREGAPRGDDPLPFARGYEVTMDLVERLETANLSPAHVLTELALSLHRAGVR
jgi:DNA polymerase-3 subunit delta'